MGANYDNGRCAMQLVWAYAQPQLMQMGSAKPAFDATLGY